MLSQIQCTGMLRAFPIWSGERIYMHEFFKSKGLPTEYKRWQDTVDTMLEGIDTDGPIYLMVDQGIVQKGETLRRPGPHIDGHWITNIQAHGIPGHRNPSPGHQNPGRHCNPLYDGKELVILTSSHYGCDALVGEYDGEYGDGGDCSHMDLSNLTRQELLSGNIYRGNVYTVHEAVPSQLTCARTVVRLNVPGVALNS